MCEPVFASQGPPSSLLLLLLLHLILLVTLLLLLLLLPPHRSHGGLSQRHEENLHCAGDQAAGQVRLRPGQDVRQRPVAAVQVVRLCRYRLPPITRGGRLLGWGALMTDPAINGALSCCCCCCCCCCSPGGGETMSIFPLCVLLSEETRTD